MASGFTPVTELNQQAQAGWDAQQAEARKAAAYNALRQQYGDQAGDPTATLQMQKYGFDQQNDPLVLQGNSLANTAAQQKNDFDQQDDPLRLQSDQDKVTNDQNTIAGNKLDVDAKQTAANLQKAQMIHGIFSGTLDGLAKDGVGVVDPNQRGALFDSHAQRIAALTGMDPSTNAELAAERKRFVEGGTDAIPDMRQDLDASLAAITSPKEKSAQDLANIKLQTAQSGAAAAKSKADLAAAKAAGKPGAGGSAGIRGVDLDPNTLNKTVAGFTKAKGTPEKIAASIGATQSFDSKLGILLGTGATGGFGGDNDRVKQYGADGLIPQTLALIEKTKGMSAIQRNIQAHIPGSDVYKLSNNLDQISHSAALTDLQNLKANGTSLGRVTNAEFQAASQALINANATADYTTLKNGLNKLGDMYYQTHNAAQKMVLQRQGDLKSWHSLVKNTVYGNPDDPAEQDDSATAPAGASTGLPAAGATGGTTSAGGGATPAPAAANTDPATMTPADLQKAGVLTGDQSQAQTPPAGVQKVDLRPPTPGFIPHANYANEQNMGNPAAPGWVQQNIIPVSVGGATFQVNKQAAPAFQSFLSDLAAEGYPVKSSGGYNYRPITGRSSGLSQHAFGNAIDINADANPLGGSKSDLPANISDLAKAHGLIWGGNFGKRKDPMHFEWAGPQAGGAPPDTPITPNTQNSVPGDGPTPPADAQTVASAAPAPGQPGTGQQPLGDVTPRGAPVKGAQPKPESDGAKQLASMTPTQVATQSVPLPSAADIVSPYNNAMRAGGGAHVAVLGDVNSILAHYGLRKKA